MYGNAAPERDFGRLDVGVVDDPPIFNVVVQQVLPRIGAMAG
jgi:hypothetical protein